MNKDSAKDATFILLIAVAAALAFAGAVAGAGWVLFKLFGGAGLAAGVVLVILAALWGCVYAEVEHRNRQDRN